MAQIETFEGLPIVDTGGRSLISALDAKKISFPNNGADFGNSGDQLRSLGNGGVEWAAPGMPTYEQTEQAISEWLNDHPEATTTVADGAITDAKLNDALKRGLVYGFEAVADMKAANTLKAGMICHTNGFYSSDDGGAAWYEISDTGTANEMDVIACGDLFASLIVGNTVNALQVGIKNDGSEDCSSAFNVLTDKYNFYFPCGEYKVENTLYPKLNVFSESFERYYDTRLFERVAVFNSYLPDGVVFEINTVNVTIRNIAILCIANEGGILVKSRCQILNCLIYGIGNSIGIELAPSSAVSRLAYLEDITIFGRGGFPTSTGIKLVRNAVDCRLNNIEIMRVQKGIHTESLVYMENVHLWGGTYDSSADPSLSWCAESCGIYAPSAYSVVVASNLYSDTFGYHIYLDCETEYNNAPRVTINNYICLADTSINWSTFNPSVIHSENGHPVVSITGGYIAIAADNLESIKDYNDNVICTIKDVIFNNTRTSYAGDNLKIAYPFAEEIYRFADGATNRIFTPIAVFKYFNSFEAKFYINKFEQYGEFAMSLVGDTLTITKTRGTGIFSIWWQLDTTNKMIYIWVTIVNENYKIPLGVKFENHSATVQLIDANMLTESTSALVYQRKQQNSADSDWHIIN